MSEQHGYSQEEQDAKKHTTKERVQIDFSIDALSRLDHLKSRSGRNSRAEVIRKALELYEWFIEETQRDDVITITNREGDVLSTFKARLLY